MRASETSESIPDSSDPASDLIFAAAAPLASVPEPPREPEPPAPAPPPLCYSIGPMLADEEISAMGEWLEGQGGQLELRVDERRELSLYWVYFPSLPSRAAAVERVSRMKAEGLNDIYIIPAGDQANAISLGVYSQRSSLDRRLRELKAKGYDPSIVPRYRTTKAAWFDAIFLAIYQYPATEFADLFPAIQMAPVTCTTSQIATGTAAFYNSPGSRRRAYHYSDHDTASEPVQPPSDAPL